MRKGGSKVVGLKSIAFALLLISTSISSSANAQNCGETLADVIYIMKTKYPAQDSAWLNNFLGNWVSDGERIRLTMNAKFQVKGYPVTFCPTSGNLFQVRYKDGGSVAGIARMLSRNRIEIGRTAIGTIYLDREGAVASQNQ